MQTIHLRKNKVLVAIVIPLIIISAVCYTFKTIVRDTNQSLASSKVRLHEYEVKTVAVSTAMKKKQTKAFQMISKSKASFLKKSGGNRLQLMLLTSGGNQFKDFMTDELGKKSNVVFWSHPMQMVERMNENWQGNDLVQFKGDPFKPLLGDIKNHNGFIINGTVDTESFFNDSIEFFQEIMSCKFTLKMTNFVKQLLKRCPDMLGENEFLRTTLNCSSKNSKWECKKTTDTLHERMNNLCQVRNRNVVVYVSDERTAAIRHLAERLDGFNVLHLVGDPRDTLYDFSMQGRIERNPFFDVVHDKIAFVCKHLLENVRYGIRSRHDKYALFRYEDFNTLNDIRRLLDIPVDTTGKIENLEHTQWRVNINQDFSSTVDNICFAAMDELGYRYLYGKEIRGDGESFRKVESNHNSEVARKLLSAHHIG